MRLRCSLTSPFARKVRLAAAVLGLPLELELADTRDPSDSLRQQNPLGKIPILLTDSGEALYDSRVILAYLDLQAGGGRLYPAAPRERIEVMQREALGDGLMDAAVMMFYERLWRPEELVFQTWLDHQHGKVTRTLEMLEANPPAEREQVDAGDITLACALGFLDLRFAGAWRAGHPRLAAWQDQLAARCTGFAETKAPDA
ncbi:glutathione S-transferase N-terminal domain-containing protein [Xanthobacter sp. TB0139]|uniref:glutathione S-transferase N-terminal domain-containing protein n=1 Tax=Xanthobacter sp. TB0139 TaxID=3459178 RepID=UPI00403943A3